jgi:outer membrane protein OmpA-like peptidoglycan-associated protein
MDRRTIKDTLAAMRGFVFCSLAALCILGCGTAPPPPAAPAEAASAPAPEPTSAAPKDAPTSEPATASPGSFGSDVQTLRFAKDSAAMTADAKKAADKLVDSIKRSSFEAVAVSVKAHSEQDSPRRRTKLDQERANAVVGYLTKHGVASALFSAKAPEGASVAAPVAGPAEFFPRVEVTVVFKMDSKESRAAATPPAPRP